MDQRQVVAEWAWISKEPGSPEDYGVLAASAGRIDVPGFAGAYVAGVPSSSLPQDAPSAPPWVTFGSHPTSVQRQMLSISAQDPWRGLDQAGRPIWPRRFFLCWYDDLAAARPSYRALWGAMAAVDLPRSDRRPVPVAISPQPLSDVVAAIGTVGFERAAAIAAALLDGPVAVTGTAGLRLADTAGALDRLALLDAVTALLPYGFRADLSVSTAVDNTVAHRIRLILAEFAGGSQHAAALRGAPVTPRSECACDYLAMLLEKERWDGLKATVAHLLDATDACSFGRPETAVELLDRLNRHRHRVRAASKGAESLELSGAFFRDEPQQVERAWRSPELDEQTRVKLLRPFLDAADDQTLGRHWDVVADNYGPLVGERLDGGDIAAALRALAIAESHSGPGAVDRLLRELVEAPRLPSRSRPGVIEARAELLRRRPVPARGTFGITRAGLRLGEPADWQARLVRELLSSEITGDPAAAGAWASWLSCPPAEDDPLAETDAPGWVAVLGYVLTGTGGNGIPDHVRSLIRQDAAWAATALGLASGSGHIRDVLAIPGLADDLVALAAAAQAQPPREETRRSLASVLAVPLWGTGLDPATIAEVDAACLLLGGRIGDFPATLARSELSRYDESFRRVAWLAEGREARPALLSRFLDQLFGAGEPRPLRDAAVWLLHAWSADERLAPVLAGFAATPAVTAMLAGDRRLDCDFWRRLVTVQPVLRPVLAVSLLRDAIEQVIADPAALTRYVDERFGVAGSELALAMYRAERSGLTTAQVIEVIRDTSVQGVTLKGRLSHRQFDDALRECGFLLAHPARGTDDATAGAEADARSADARRVLLEFRKLICAGSLGTGYGAEFRFFLYRRLRDEQKVSRRLRRLFRPSDRWRIRRAAPVPSAAPAGKE